MSLSAAKDVNLIWLVYVQLYHTIPTKLDALAIYLEGENKDGLCEGSNNLGIKFFCILDNVSLNRPCS